MNGWLETYQGQVNAWECDMMEHMNVQFYRTRLSEGLGRLYARLGLTPAVIRSDRRTLLTAAERILYQRELRAGSLCHMRSGIISVGNRSVKTVHELIDSESGHVSASFEVTGAYYDIDTGKSIPLPKDIRNRSAERMVSWKPAYPSNPPSHLCASRPTGRRCADRPLSRPTARTLCRCPANALRPSQSAWWQDCR